LIAAGSALASHLSTAEQRRIFHGLFYSLEIFSRKTAQFYDAHCKLHLLRASLKSTYLQRYDNLSNSLGLKCESPALTAKLQAHTGRDKR
jgi:hypothetical protein